MSLCVRVHFDRHTGCLATRVMRDRRGEGRPGEEEEVGEGERGVTPSRVMDEREKAGEDGGSERVRLAVTPAETLERRSACFGDL